MSKAATDNSYFYDKVMLRINHLPDLKEITVLDAFSSEGKIWKEIKKISSKKINVIRIDEGNKSGIYMKGNNLKFLKKLNLNEFDIIDLDSYGVPYSQLEVIFAKYLRCTVFITFIQSVFGILPKNMLIKIGYKKSMIEKTPILFTKNGLAKMKLYLSINGIDKIYIRSSGRKHYFCFKIKNDYLNQ